MTFRGASQPSLSVWVSSDIVPIWRPGDTLAGADASIYSTSMQLVFLYGPVAAGKLTVARRLARLTGHALFHNHLIVDAVGAVFPFGSPAFVKLRERFWVETFAEAASVGCSLIFTYAPESTVTSDFLPRTVAAVEGAGGKVRFVRLTISDEEQERRIANPDRTQHGKLVSLNLLRELRPMFRAAEQLMPEPLISVDTGSMSSERAAETIAEALG